tara:strand:+ start:338 stop:562 length:225 start_codon:yes stop_codon:yes gene_type:complete
VKLENIEMATQSLSFVNQDEIEVTYEEFDSIPFITATSNNNINIFSENITRRSCTIRTSSKITGIVYIHILGIK